MPTREEIIRWMDRDGIEYLLTQFVDLNGSPKVKMVPVAHFDDVLEVGAGFGGAALVGMGQGPHSHDMMARIDLDSYTPAPWGPAIGAVCLRSVRGRGAASLLSAAEFQAIAGRGAGCGLRF